MLELQMRPSLRFVQQVAQLERFAGRWEKLSRDPAIAGREHADAALAEGVRAALLLDSTTPASVSTSLTARQPQSSRFEIEQELHRDGVLLRQTVFVPRVSQGNGVHEGAVHHPLRETFYSAHLLELPFNLQAVDFLYSLLTNESQPASDWLREASTFEAAKLRRTAAAFRTPEDQVVFQTVSSFLVEQRLEELISWTRRELRGGLYHPLAVIGTFYLLFLQVSPYPEANHRLCQLLAWRLLAAEGFEFIRFHHFSPWLLERSDQYFTALRRSEKTAHSNWSTLNVWLEFFLDSLLSAARELDRRAAASERTTRLTDVQKQILDVVQDLGAVTRDRIVRETGINLSTVKYNLTVLAERGQLQRHGAGRTTSYTIA